MLVSSNKGSLVIHCITNKSSNTMKNTAVEYLKYLKPKHLTHFFWDQTTTEAIRHTME